MRDIIQSVDRYGLRKRIWGKHKQKRISFSPIDDFKELSFLTSPVNIRNGFRRVAQMFTSLDHDGVRLGTTTTQEHAIKRFAKSIEEEGTVDLQSELSGVPCPRAILKLAKFNNVNVLKFLLSKETSLAGLFQDGKARGRIGLFAQPRSLVQSEIQSQ